MLRALAALCLILTACDQGRISGGPNLNVILADEPAEKLSDYGLFLDAGARVPADRVVEYDLINPLFSDHSDKHRYIYVPPGETVSYHPTEAFEFPVGSVIVKTFSYGDDFVETRLLVHKEAGWQAYPYVWTADDADAVYTPIGAKRTINTFDPKGSTLTINYTVPNKNQCKTCHGKNDVVMPIGPKTRHLGAQVRAWSDVQMLIGMPDVVARVPATNDVMAPLEQRARAYLEINCAHCHREGGSASNSGLWLEWHERSAARLGIMKRPTAAGRGSGSSLKVIVPGEPEHSILAFRMATTEAGVAMPELSRSLIDEEGVELINAWIADMEGVEP